MSEQSLPVISRSSSLIKRGVNLLRKSEPPAPRVGPFELKIDCDDARVKSHTEHLFNQGGVMINSYTQENLSCVASSDDQDRVFEVFTETSTDYSGTKKNYAHVQVDDPKNDYLVNVFFTTESYPGGPRAIWGELIGREEPRQGQVDPRLGHISFITQEERQKILDQFLASKYSPQNTRERLVKELRKLISGYAGGTSDSLGESITTVGLFNPKSPIKDVLDSEGFIHPKPAPADVIRPSKHKLPPSTVKKLVDNEGLKDDGSLEDKIRKAFPMYRDYLPIMISQVEGFGGHEVILIGDWPRSEYWLTERGQKCCQLLSNAIGIFLQDIKPEEAETFKTILYDSGISWSLSPASYSISLGVYKGFTKPLRSPIEEVSQEKPPLPILDRLACLGQLSAEIAQLGSLKWSTLKRNSSALNHLAQLEGLSLDEVEAKYFKDK